MSEIKIRPGKERDVPEISRVFANSWRTTYEGLVPEAFLKGLTEEAAAKLFNESLASTTHSYFLHVAEDTGGRIVGFVDGGKERSHPESGMGELYAIYLLQEFQGQGTGRRLFEAATESLTRSGITSMIVWVLEQSPYRKFYESVGGKLETGIKRLDLASQQVKLVPYRWNHLKI
jgi:GNAT superfamily N-acetyltransferase